MTARSETFPLAARRAIAPLRGRRAAPRLVTVLTLVALVLWLVVLPLQLFFLFG